MHRWADRGDRLPTPAPPDAVERAAVLASSLRGAFGPGLRCDVTALPSGAVAATAHHGARTASVHASPDGDEWGVSVDRSGDTSALGPDHVVTSVDDVVEVLRATWPPAG